MEIKINQYKDFVKFKYDKDVNTHETIVGDINLFMNGPVFDSVISKKVSTIISDYLFNSCNVHSFISEKKYEKVSNYIKSELSNYKYSLIVDKMSSYVMDIDIFMSSTESSMYVGEACKNKIYLGTSTDYHDSKILYFNSELEFIYRFEKSGSNYYIYWDINMDISNNHICSYIVDDRGNRLVAKWRQKKLKIFKNIL